jgi:hypothetical protein
LISNGPPANDQLQALKELVDICSPGPYAGPAPFFLPYIFFKSIVQFSTTFRNVLVKDANERIFYPGCQLFSLICELFLDSKLYERREVRSPIFSTILFILKFSLILAFCKGTVFGDFHLF